MKSYEASGFSWVELHAPPASVLREPRQCIRHARGVAASLATAKLGKVIRAPAGTHAGMDDGDRALEGLLAYAAEVGAALVAYHALAFLNSRGSEDRVGFEVRSLARLASVAERLEVTIGVENGCPRYPGPEMVSADPRALRSLILRVESPHLALVLDVGHAHVVADLRHTGVERLIEPVLDSIAAFRLHDNLGARRGAAGEDRGIDPLRLDLHLPLGQGTVPWKRIAPLLRGHRAPLLLDVHSACRPLPVELAADAAALLGE